MNKRPDINVDDWERPFVDPKNSYVYMESKTKLVFNLQKCFPKLSIDSKKAYIVETMLSFNIKRLIFVNSIDTVCRYLDYFIEFYDKDKILPMILLKIKKEIDIDDNLTSSEFLKLISDYVFKDAKLKRLVYKMIKENNKIDITYDAKTKRTFNEKFDFTNEDANKMLSASMIMKILIPPLAHYLDLNSNNFLRKKNNIMPAMNDITVDDFIINLFIDTFYKTINEKKKDTVPIVTKLYYFVRKKVQSHALGNDKMWKQQNALRGVTAEEFLDNILIKNILSDNFFKINMQYNITHYLKSIVEQHLLFSTKKIKYSVDPKKVDGVKDINGLSSLDRLEQSLPKTDEFEEIMSRITIPEVLAEMESQFGEIEQEEIDYYMENFNTGNKFNNTLLFYLNAKRFIGYNEFRNLKKEDHIRLLILTKRELRSQKYDQLPQLLSSIAGSKLTLRIVQNSKFLNKYENSERFKILQGKYKSTNGYLEEDPILTLISFAINNTFYHLDFEHKEKTGEKIEFNPDVISDEITTMIENI